MDNQSPFFSIVIPTRNRHDTLYYSIQTVLEQSFDDFELIISDNHSSIETSQCIQKFSDQRLKYFRTDADLSMIDSWEFALNKTKGKYVIFFGDDDGLIKDALKFIRETIDSFYQRNEKIFVMNWQRVGYYWPDIIPPELSNRMSMPLHKSIHGYYLNGQAIIREVIHNKKYYTILPMMYNSVVHREVIHSIKKDHGGYFFASNAPDVYSGFTLANYAKTYLHLTIPLSINGASKYSNGISFMYARRSNKINKEFLALNANAQTK